MAKSKDNNRESENPLQLLSSHSVGGAGNDTTEDFWLCKSTPNNFAVEWYVESGVVNFDLILQFKQPDGTYIDDDAGGANNGDVNSKSTILTAEATARGIRQISLEGYWARPLRFRINNDDVGASVFNLWVHRDAYTRRK